MGPNNLIETINMRDPDFLERDGKDGYVCPFCGSGSGPNHTGLKLIPKVKECKVWMCFSSCNRSYNFIQLYGKKIYGYSVDQTKNNFMELIKEISGESIMKSKYVNTNRGKESQLPQSFEQTEKYEIAIFQNYKANIGENISFNTFNDLASYIKNLRTGSTNDNKDGFSFSNPLIDQRQARGKTNTRPSRTIFIDIEETPKELVNKAITEIEQYNACWWYSHSSTEDSPRVKAIVDIGISPQTNEEWSNINKSFGEMLVNKVGEISCTDYKNSSIKLYIDKTCYEWSHLQCSTPANSEIHLSSGKVYVSKKKGIIPFQDLINEDIYKLKNETYIPSGISMLDNILGGGFMCGSLTVIGGKSSIGKSALLTQIADNAANCRRDNCKVVYVSYEMASRENLKRSLIRSVPDDSLTMQNFNDLIKTSPDQISTVADAYKQLIGENLIYMDTLHSNKIDTDIKSLKNRIAEYKKEYSNTKTLLIIDYLQYITSDEYKNEYERLNHITAELKGLCDDDIAILVISSLNRDSYDSEPSLKMFKGSGLIEFTANCALILSEANVCKIPNSNKNMRCITIVKGRDIKSGSGVLFNFNGLKCKYTEKQIFELGKTQQNGTVNGFSAMK